MIHAAYGSSKDINVYAGLGLKSDKIFVIGKPSRRQSNLGNVTWIPNGYAEHLANLTIPGGSRPAEGNARMVIPKNFGPPGLQRRRTLRATASRTPSYPFGAPEQQQPQGEYESGIRIVDQYFSHKCRISISFLTSTIVLLRSFFR